MTTLTTNLADLPLRTFRQLSQCLVKNDIWIKIIDEEVNSIYSISNDEIEGLLKHQDPGGAIIRIWGNRGQTVFDFLSRLQKLSRIHEDDLDFDQPQLVLNRKFKELRWGREEEVVITIDNNLLHLDSKAVGFPSPIISWFHSNNSEEAIYSGRVLTLPRCKCSLKNSYICQAFNEIPDGFSFSSFYRKPSKKFSSSLKSKVIDLSEFIKDDECCEECRLEEIKRLEDIYNNGEEDDINPSLSPNQNSLNDYDSGSLIAADKVALLISNCAYTDLPELMTPHCDSQTLADALRVDMKFKTVTLADLTLEEMKYFVKEYRKLVGNGVYAVFYFVGHGFEVNGQCYLLGIDAPKEPHSPEHALSMDWVLSVLQDVSPALNLILLDVCRKFVPYKCIPSFIEYSEHYKRRNRPHRNLVFGYSTSGGVGAYEVRGEYNGVFMKYLKNHVTLNYPVIDMLNRVLNDIGNDSKVCDVQIPEIRSTLTHPRSLTDKLICDGHTVSFHSHTVHWRLIHELPTPAVVRFDELQLAVTLWFQYSGAFTNKVYIFSSVAEIGEPNECEEVNGKTDKALDHRALLYFPPEIQRSSGSECEDKEEGVSLRYMLSGLQKIRGNGELHCVIELRNIHDLNNIIIRKSVNIGHILITKIKGLVT